MNSKLTEIALILDRSGSMKPHQKAVISGFNHFLQQQLDVPGDARLTLALFDDEYLVPLAATPIEEVPRLDISSYVPRGRTRLLDAAGKTIDALGRRFAITPEAERPGKVVVAVVTDGLENASHRFTAKDISSRIRHQREKYGWEFLYLGANHDAFAAASHINVDRHCTSSMTASAPGIYGAIMATSRKVRSLRQHAMGMADADFGTSLSMLVAKETKAAERRERHGKPAPTTSPPMPDTGWVRAGR